ncbi:MAG: hypothetical protein ACKO96_05900 [Flammeovirgaceae bacterium]
MEINTTNPVLGTICEDTTIFVSSVGIPVTSNGSGRQPSRTVEKIKVNANKIFRVMN